MGSLYRKRRLAQSNLWINHDKKRETMCSVRRDTAWIWPHGCGCDSINEPWETPRNAMGTLFSLGQPIPSAKLHKSDPCSWPLGNVTKANYVAYSCQLKHYFGKGCSVLMSQPVSLPSFCLTGPSKQTKRRGMQKAGHQLTGPCPTSPEQATLPPSSQTHAGDEMLRERLLTKKFFLGRSKEAT